jgi:hypothetical protein
MHYLNARMFEFLARFYVAIREREQECEASSSRKQITVMKALSTSSADNSNCFLAASLGSHLRWAVEWRLRPALQGAALSMPK